MTGLLSLFSAHSKILMAFRKLFSQLRRSRRGDTETQSTDPTAPPSPQSLQLEFRSSESTLPPLRRQNSGGKQCRYSVQFQSIPTVSFVRNSWNDVTNSIRFRPSPPRSQCRWKQTWESLQSYRRFHRCTREQAELEVDCIRLSRTRHRCLKGIIRCLHTSQVCSWRPLCRPKILRCAASLFY